MNDFLRWGVLAGIVITVGVVGRWWLGTLPNPSVGSEIEAADDPRSSTPGRRVTSGETPTQPSREPLDRAHRAVAEHLESRWIRCDVAMELPKHLLVDGVSRESFDGGVFRAAVATGSGGGLITPRFEKLACNPSSFQESMDCDVENNERKKDATFPVAVLQWWGAEIGAVGSCVIRPAERITLRGQVEGGRMGAVWACGQRILVTDGRFEIEGYANTFCDFAFDDGITRGEVRLATGDGTQDFLIPSSTGDEHLPELERQELTLQEAEAAMTTGSELSDLASRLDPEEAAIVQSWLDDELSAREEALSTARSQLEKSLQIEEVVQELKGLMKPGAEPTTP